MAENNRRRRRSLASHPIGTAVAVGVVAYGVYWTGKYAWNALFPTEDEDEEKNTTVTAVHSDATSNSTLQSTAARSSTCQRPQPLQITKAQFHRRSQACVQDARILYSQLAGGLFQTLHRATTVASAQKQLKGLRNEKWQCLLTQQLEHQLWRKVQTETLTRVLTAAYAHTVLFFVVWTQVHWMGNQTMINNMMVQESSSTTAAQVDTTTELCALFLNDGVNRLLDTVRSAVEKVLESSLAADWDCLDPAWALHMARPKVERTIDAVRERCLEDTHFLTRCFPATDTTPHVNEMLDLFDSPLVKRAFKDALSTTFSLLQHDTLHRIFQEDQHLPVAKVVAKLKNVVSKSTFAQPKSHDNTDTSICYWSHWSTLASVREVGKVVLLDSLRVT